MNRETLLNGWDCDENRNILSPPNLDILNSAFRGHENVVFGFHYWYCGGQGHTNFAYRRLSDLIGEIEHSRPGDHFTIFSLSTLAHIAEASVAFDKQTLDNLFVVLRAMSENTEIVVVFDVESPRVEVVWNLDDRDISDLSPSWSAAGQGTVHLFRMSKLDFAEDGTVVHSVTPRAGDRRLHALLDAKRPAQDGSTPSRGPY